MHCPVARRSARTGTAQGLGPNASDGEAFLKAVKEDDANKAVELANQPGAGSSIIAAMTAKRRSTSSRASANLIGSAYLLARAPIPTCVDSKGDTPLMIASAIGFEEAAAQMLRRGAKVDATNRRGETALTVAVQQRQPRLVELLLKAGANPDKTDHVTGYSPRDYAKRDTRNPQLLKLIETIKPTAKKAVAGPKIN